MDFSCHPTGVDGLVVLPVVYPGAVGMVSLGQVSVMRGAAVAVIGIIAPGGNGATAVSGGAGGGGGASGQLSASIVPAWCVPPSLAVCYESTNNVCSVSPSVPRATNVNSEIAYCSAGKGNDASAGTGGTARTTLTLYDMNMAGFGVMSTLTSVAGYSGTASQQGTDAVPQTTTSFMGGASGGAREASAGTGGKNGGAANLSSGAFKILMTSSGGIGGISGTPPVPPSAGTTYPGPFPLASTSGGGGGGGELAGSGNPGGNGAPGGTGSGGGGGGDGADGQGSGGSGGPGVVVIRMM